MKQKKEINITIGDNIRRERERAGLTQEVLAELIEMGPNNLSDVERGVVGISLTNLRKICIALHVSSDRLIFGEGSDNDVTAIAEQLGRLSPRQFEITNNVLKSLMDAFMLDD